MPAHGIEKNASDPTKRASCKWKCLQLVPKAERHCFLVQVSSRGVHLPPWFHYKKEMLALLHKSGKPHLQPWARWTFQEKSLRHSAKQCLDYTGSQRSRVVVMLDKPHQIGWNKSSGWSPHLFLKMKSISGTSRCAPRADFHKHPFSLLHLKLLL